MCDYTSVFLNCWFTANFYRSEKLFLPKVFYLLKLLGIGDSKDEKILSEKEQQQSH
jgi:hypothetical protein